MAHGFLTPTPVTGESPIAKYLQKKIEDKIEKESKKLWEKTKSGLSDLYKKLTKAKTTYRGKGVGRVDVTGPRDPVAGGMLPGIKPKGLLSPSNNSLVKRTADSLDTPEIDPISGNRLPPSMGPSSNKEEESKKGGTFTDIGGSQVKPLNTENFFAKAVSEGVNANTGQYLSKEERISAFKAGKVERSQSGGPSISADSGVDIVAAVNKNTQMIVSLVDAVKAQTANDSKIVQEQIQTQQQLMLRSSASAEEAALEQGNDFSGFMTPENFAKRKKNEKKKEENDKGSKLKEFFRGPNPFQKPEGCGCSPFMPGPGGRGGPILGGPPGGGLPVPDYVDQWRDMNRRPGSRLGGGGSVTRRTGGARRATRLATKIGGKGAGKAVSKGLGKGLLKKIPGVGLLAGGAFAAERAMKGDLLGAGGELLSGVASLIPGIGTAVSTGIDAGLMARDAGLTPFAKGGIITQPTASLMGEGNKAEGVFPLEGTRGKKTFRMFGEGVLNAQMDNDTDFAKLQAKGFKQYFETEGGGKKLGESLKDFFGTLAGGIASLFGGAANAGTLDQAADYLGAGANTSSLASFIGGLESGNDYTKMVGGKQDASVLNKTIDELEKEKGGQFAMGRYQIQMRTAKDVLKGAGIDTSKFKFDQAGQDKIFELLLKRRGLDDFMSGKISKDQFAKNLSKEWAALPTDATGRGFYDGVGTNKSLTSYSSVLGQLDSLKASGNAFQGGPGTQVGSGGAALAATATRLKGLSTNVKETDYGRNGCVYAVNKVFQAAGITPPWGSALYVPTAEEKMIKAGWQKVPYNQAAPGDVMVMKDRGSPPATHIGIMQSNGKVLSNSSGKAKMTWEDTIAGYNSYYGGQGVLYRMPGTSVAAARNPPPSNAQPAVASRRQGQGSRRSTTTSPGSLQASVPQSTPGPVPASPAAPNTGTAMMATSQQVAMGTMGLTTGGGSPTIINNYYGGGGQQGGVNSNAVFPGIGMEQTGTTVFQELKMRSLA